MSDNDSGTPHDEEGQFVWPIPEAGINYQDALQTLFFADDARLRVSAYDETGYKLGNELIVDFSDDDEHTFRRASLKQLIEDDLHMRYLGGIEEGSTFDSSFDGELWTEDDWAEEYRLERLEIMLLRTIAEWEATDAKRSPAELRQNPLPAWAPPKCK